MKVVYLIGNGRVITRDSEHPYYEKGAVVVDADHIVEVGVYETLKEKYPQATFVDAQQKVIMPGLINTHAHIYSAFARGMRVPGKTPEQFLEILEKLWWKMDARLSLEDVYESACFTLIESIKNGVTTVIDHHASYGETLGSLSEIAKAAGSLEIRSCLSYEISDRHGKEKMLEAVEENMTFVEQTIKNPSDQLKALIGLHAPFTLSEETLRYIQKVNTFETGYHVHIAEGVYDETFNQTNYGKSAARRLYEHEMLGEQTLAVHCIHIGEEDYKLLKETNTTVIHNPSSNMNNAVGWLDILKLMDQGILVGLGTDGYTNDMLESLKVAHILQKHGHQNAARGFNEACTCLFENNAKIATRLFEKEIGKLKKGAKADLILVGYHPFTPMHAENINGHVMFGMQGSMTEDVMIDGKWVMKNRKLVSVDEEAVRKSCEEQAQSFWKRFMA